MPTIYKDVEVEVDVDLSDFNDEALIDEIESRGLEFTNGDEVRELLTAVFEKKRLGKDYERELDALIYCGLGRIV